MYIVSLFLSFAAYVPLCSRRNPCYFQFVKYAYEYRPTPVSRLFLERSSEERQGKYRSRAFFFDPGIRPFGGKVVTLSPGHD